MTSTDPAPKTPFQSADEYVGERVHQLAWRNRVSQQQIGEVIRVGQDTVSKKMRGLRSWSIDELIAVARFFDVSVDDLLPGNDYDPVLSGRGRGSVRHVGLEPTTR